LGSTCAGEDAQRQADQAEDAIRRAISLDPRDGQFSVILATIQMDFRNNIHAAITALNVAHDLGATNREWALRMAICSLLVGKTDVASGIFAAVTQDMGSEANAFFREVIEGVRKLSGETEGKSDDAIQRLVEVEEQLAASVGVHVMADKASGEATPTSADAGSSVAGQTDIRRASYEDEGASDEPLSVKINNGGCFLNTKFFM
jgi:hypothetical protein